MGSSLDHDVVRLAVPADDALVPVVTETVRVVGIRFGLTTDDIDAAQRWSAEAFAEVLPGAKDGRVEIELRATPALAIQVTAGDSERATTIPAT